MLSLLPLLPLLGKLVSAATYPRIESWSGSGFLDGFEYDASAYDNTTNGDTFWATAANTSLIYTSGSGTTILKVDNTTVVPYNEKRYAPKLHSKTHYEIGTVWVMDAVHMPYGCSVWPAFWTQGENWPAGGEIDIMEGINQQTTNQIALHAEATNCIAQNSSAMLGTVSQSNCSTEAGSGAGCTVVDSRENSYGSGFAAAGGGVYVAELATDGIRVWFLSRADVPSTLTADAESIDTSVLGTPVAEYSSSGCDISQYFGPQILTINIALCGDWAGQATILEETCPQLTGDLTCYTTYVINDAGATYANAYFELNYINVYSSSSGSSGSSGSSTGASASNGTTTTRTAGAGSTSQPASSPTGAAGRKVQWDGLGLGWAGLALAGTGAGMSLVL